MLKVMRQSFQHLKWVLWLVVFVFVAFVFVDWGMGRVRGGGLDPSVVAKVGNQALSTVDFNRQYRQVEDRYRQMYRQNWSPELVKALNLPAQVVSQMIDHQLAVDAARKAGLTVSNSELAEKIAALPAFQKNGAFVGAAQYSDVLASNGYTTDEFEHEFREDLLIEKYNRLVSSSLMVPEASVRAEFERQNDKAKIEYVLVAAPRLATPVKPTESDLLKYFEANKDRFRQPERRKVKYLLVDQAKLREKFRPSPAEIQSYYQAHQDEFPAPERVHAAHILIKVDANASPAEKAAARKKAEEIAQKARAGEDFAELAKKYSEDPGSKDKGGDLGTFGKGAMVPAFEQAAFSMEPGEIRGPVESQFGYHVIKLIEKFPAGVRPLPEVSARIAAELSQNAVKAAEARRAEAIEKKVSRHESDENLRRLADDTVTFNETGWITARGAVPGVGYAPEFLKTAFALKKGEVAASAVPTPAGPAIVKVEDVRAPGIPDFAEVKAQVQQDYEREKGSEQAVAAAAPLGRELAAGKTTLEEIAKTYSGKVQTPAEFGKGAPLPGLGSVPDLDQAVFATPEGSTGGPVAVPGKGVAFFKVVSRTEASPALFVAQKDQIRESLRQEEAQKLIQAVLEKRRAQEKIQVNDELLSRYGKG